MGAWISEWVGVELEVALRGGYKDFTAERYRYSLDSQWEWERGRGETTRKVLRQGEELRLGEV